MVNVYWYSKGSTFRKLGGLIARCDQPTLKWMKWMKKDDVCVYVHGFWRYKALTSEPAAGFRTSPKTGLGINLSDSFHRKDNSKAMPDRKN